MRRLTVIIALLPLVAFLHYQFPYVLEDESARMNVLYTALLLVFLLGGSRAFAGRPISKVLRDAGIWLGVLVLLVTAYSFRDEFGHSRLMAELLPSHVQLSDDGTISIRSSDGGHFYVDGTINGARVRFLIDTGASDIVLAPADAKRAGFDPDSLDYSRIYTTANGNGRGASVILKSLTIGPVTLDHMPASVNRAWMQESLLGMSFLRKLKGFRVEGNTLVLMP